MGRAAHPLERSYGAGFDGAYVQRFPKPVRLAVANPQIGLDGLDKLDCEESLSGFIKTFWPTLEPGRQFVPGYAVDAICDHLQAVTRGHIRKLLMNVPPGCMKSLTTNVFWPAWEWGPMNMAELRYISASYSQDLTYRDNRKCRQVIDDPKYQRLWGDRVQIAPDQDAKGKFENTRRGWKLATSVGGAVVGERGDRFIIDDPHNIKQAESERVREATLQWFTEVVPTRVNNPDEAVFVVIMQRVHERDVSGLILAKELGYEYLCLPMEYEPDHPHPCRNTIGFKDWRKEQGELLWPERFSGVYLENLKTELRSWGGGYAEAGQLQQRPAPRGGGMFKRAWWRFFESGAKGYGAAARPAGCSDAPAEPLPTLDEEVMSVDASFKETANGSRVAIGVIGRKGAKRFVLHRVAKHMGFTETVNTILQVLALYPRCRKVLIEDKANGSALVDVLRVKVPGVIAINPAGGKESRAAAIEPVVEAGQALLPEGAPWLEDWIAEFASFPVAENDDQVDMFTQALIYMGANAAMARAIAMGTW